MASVNVGDTIIINFSLNPLINIDDVTSSVF